MSTLADELLQDFEDSASGEEEEGAHNFLENGETEPKAVANGSRRKNQYTDHDGGMELDDDEEDAVDEEMKNGVDDANVEGLEDGDNQEDAKAKVEKMQLGGVDDVRSVAGLMKTLEPVLEVSPSHFIALRSQRIMFTSCGLDIRPDSTGGDVENCAIPVACADDAERCDRLDRG